MGPRIGLAVLLVVLTVWTTASEAANMITVENWRPGTSTWQITNAAQDGEIEGYASLTSVNRGEQIKLFVNTSEPSYVIDVYRMGWYQGRGARLIIGNIRRRGLRQPIPEPEAETGLIECDWTDPYILTTANPAERSDWISGIYIAKLTAQSGKQNFIIFVVREDERPSEYLYQSSVTTFQAYNNWGGKSLYQSNSVGRPARKLSFNRPYAPSENPLAASGSGAGEFFTNNSSGDQVSPAGWEYNMVRWLEREGYDVTYSTNIDTHAIPDLLIHHRGWLSVGHDEYWSWNMREHIERARDLGVGLAFFSANVCYWQIRFEPSLLTGEANRTMVSYKEDPDDEREEDPYLLDVDPTNDYLVTGRWRTAPVNRPEESLLGVMYESNPVDADLVVTNVDSWVMSGTGLRVSDRLPGLLGYEVDRVFGSEPASTMVLAHSPYILHGHLKYADMVVSDAPRGATVFATGSIQWSWGLDDYNVPILRTSRLNEAAQQMTRNVLARLVGNHFPVARLTTVTEGAELVFDARSSTDDDGMIIHYEWDYGDGTTGTGAESRHRYQSAGHYTIGLLVVDDRGAAHRTSETLSVHEGKEDRGPQ